MSRLNNNSAINVQNLLDRYWLLEVGDTHAVDSGDGGNCASDIRLSKFTHFTKVYDFKRKRVQVWRIPLLIVAA